MSSEDTQKVLRAAEAILKLPKQDSGEIAEHAEQFRLCITRARQILQEHVTSKIPAPIAVANGAINEPALLRDWQEFAANLKAYRQELDAQLGMALEHGEKFARPTEGYGKVLNEFAQEGENWSDERWHSLYKWPVLKEMIIQDSSVQRARKQLLVHSKSCANASIANELRLLADTQSQWGLDASKELLVGVLRFPENYSDASGICDVLSGVASVFDLSSEFRRRSTWFLYETYEGEDKSELLQGFEAQYGAYEPSEFTSFRDYSEQLYAEQLNSTSGNSRYDPAQLWTELTESDLTQSDNSNEIKFELPDAGSSVTSIPSIPPVISVGSNEIVAPPIFASSSPTSSEEHQSENGALLVSGLILCLFGLLLWRVFGCFIPQALFIAGIVQLLRWHFKKS